MSHPFGDLLSQHLHRKHGLSQARLAEGILQDPSLIGKMCKGERLYGPKARQRVTAIIRWLQQQGALTTVDEANALLNAAGMSPLSAQVADEAVLMRSGSVHAQQQRQSVDARMILPRRADRLPRHNLPPQLTSFIGRTVQISHLVAHVETCRLLTLTGTGGVGKTRLALEIASRLLANFADGVWFVDLAPLTDPDLLPQRILDLWRVPEQAVASPLTALTTYLSAKQVLLILDNCEHLIDACATVVETLLQHCPRLALLATSREALNIQNELPWCVPSLTRPPSNAGWQSDTGPVSKALTPATLAQFEAVALFVERVRRQQPDFALTTANAPAVAQICSRLDGIPLALEMAAARVHVFTVEEMAAQLDGAFDKRFQLLTSGMRTAPYRHQTLRATLEWSYALLTPAEQQMLMRLSVFTGGWTVVAAEAVTGTSLDLLAQLVNKSLVIADQQAGQTRYRLLETVRQFAAEQLMLDEQIQRQIQWQHSRYYLCLLGEQEAYLQSQQQQTALAIIRADFANICTAWHWVVDHHEFTLLAPATHALFLYCEVRGQFREGALLFTAAAAELTSAVTKNATKQPFLRPLLGQVLARLGACEAMGSRYESAVKPLEQALSYVTTDWERAFTLAYLGHAGMGQGEWSAGRAKLQQSLALSRQGQDPGLMAQALYLLNAMASEYTAAIRGCEESLTLWRQVGRRDRIVEVLNRVALWTYCLGDYAKAIAYWQESIASCTALGMQDALAWARNGLGWVAWCLGDLTTAQCYLQEAAELYRTIGLPSGVGYCLSGLVLVLRSGGNVEQAVAVAHQAVAIERTTEDRMMLVLSLISLGAALIGTGDFAAARQALKEVFQRLLVAQYPFFAVIAFYYFAELLVLESHGADLPLATERKALSVTLLSCVRSQTATWQIYKDKAAQLQAEIEDVLPAELRTTAIARGQNCSLEGLVKTLLGEVEAG